MSEHPAIEYVRNLQGRILETEKSLGVARDTEDVIGVLVGMLGVVGDCILLGVEVQLILSQEASDE